MRRPTMRLADWIGMRRSERSTIDDERNHRDHHDDQQHHGDRRKAAPCLVAAF